MYYFAIFDKRGILRYQDGQAPSFFNNLVGSIDPKQTVAKRQIRDDLMEYEIRGQMVYMAISRRGILSEKIAQFEPIVERLGDNECIEEGDLPVQAAEQPETPVPQAGRGGVSKKTTRREAEQQKAKELELGERPTGILETVNKMGGMAASRAFRLFSNKIAVEELHEKMVEHLIKKNVEISFSRMIADDVVAECKGTGQHSVTEGTFKEIMARTVARLLPLADPGRLLQSIREHGPGYSICFVGVNGVGKSTTLAKIACWLIQSGLRVYIAACDTFRAGAIEQLKVHVERFKSGGHEVGFYESGYSKDDASVAKAATARAVRDGYDVILIDTAGRMHKKESLMQGLSRLIKVNNPDHILFVGEALVGGDSLAHIQEFNRWIGEGARGRRIDSIVLTKVDTVDDKIGQVVNLSFASSSPILFLGVGQGNSDLMPLESEFVTSRLVG